MKLKTKTWNKIQKPFKALGIELKESCGLYEFEYNHTQVFLSVTETDESIAFVAYVFGVDKEKDKNILDSAFDIMNDFHKGYCVEWNEGIPFFASPNYCLKGIGQVSTDWLSAELREFVEAYMFLEANVYLLCGSGF